MGILEGGKSMIKKDSLKIKLIASILFIIIMLVPFTSATDIIMNTTNKEVGIKKISQIQIENLNYIEDFEHISVNSNTNKLNIEKSLEFLHLFIKFIKLRFNEYPKLTALCQKVLPKLDILGRDWSGFICIILFQIFWIIDEISYFLIFDLGFPILGNIISIPLNFIDMLFASHCSWMFPYYLFPIQNLRNISGQTQSARIFPCHCINQ